MAQQSILRHSICQGLFEGIHLVEPFAGVDAFPEEILIYIGGGGRVWIDSRIAGKDPRKGRARRAFQRNADAWLQDRADERRQDVRRPRSGAACGAGELRVGEEAERQVPDGGVPQVHAVFHVAHDEVRDGDETKNPADPFLFSCAPATTTMKKVKRNLRFAAVLSIEFFNTVFRGLENLSVLRHSLN